MHEILRHRGADELSAFFANIKSQLKRLRPDRNPVTHGAYMGKSNQGELCFRLPTAFILAEGEQTSQKMFVFTVPQLKQHIVDITKIAISLLNKFDYQEMCKLLDLQTRAPRQTE